MPTCVKLLTSYENCLKLCKGQHRMEMDWCNQALVNQQLRDSHQTKKIMVYFDYYG